MNWKYIAGFFDGEGSIVSGSGVSSVYVRISQKNRHILDDIRFFLSANGIVSGITFDKRVSKPSHNLYLASRSSVTLFLTSIFPYLRVKKTIAQDALRLMIMHPRLPNRYH